MKLNTPILLTLGLSLLLKLPTVLSQGNWAPLYHLAPENGWMNDPNGLSYFDEYYHAFYQHNPNDTKWGLMHWGHARSKDMLDWEHLPIALVPSLAEDIDGVFSGSAVINNGNLTLIYTGVSGDYAHQMQCLATSSDGITFSKEGVVLRRDEDDKDFRDPKAWWQDDSWFVVLGSKTSVNETDRGEVLLYKSSDLYTWESQGVLAQANEKQGYMWECPDFFTLGDKQILVVNPQGIEPDGDDYQNLYQTGYFVGSWTPGSEFQIEKQFREIDHGHDFYASQTFLAPDGRRILIGWLDMWESVFPESSEGWAGMLSLPRELTLSDSGDLQIKPIREIQDRRQNMSAIKKSNIKISQTTHLEDSVVGNEFILGVDLLMSTIESFGIQIGSDDISSDEGVKVIVNTTEERVYLQRYYPNYNIPLTTRSVPINVNGNLTLDVFIDRSSIEVFVNNGQAVLSSRIYPNDGERNMTLILDSGLIIITDYEYYYL